MHYEVEQKYPVDDLSAVETRLNKLGATVFDAREEADLYYNHPSRDFAETDEGLRIRRTDGENCITYKGPKIDSHTKTRREIELPLASGPNTPEAWGELLEALGFRPVAEVRKTRRKVTIPWQDREIEGTLDTVSEVGTFVELELGATEAELDVARACIASLAGELGLTRNERQGYLEMLLAKRRSC